MFDKARYLTRGIQEEVDPILQLFMWKLIDKFQKEQDIPQDYLQVFKIKKLDEGIKIIHSQEEPDYKQEYNFDFSIDRNTKVYVIDDGDHSTMLLAEEY